MTITKIWDKKAKGKWENGVNQRHFYSVLNGTSTLSLFDWKISSFLLTWVQTHLAPPSIGRGSAFTNSRLRFMSHTHDKYNHFLGVAKKVWCQKYLVISKIMAMDPFGWKSFKVSHTKRKGPNPYFNHFLPYILIPIKNNESKVVKICRRTIF